MIKVSYLRLASLRKVSTFRAIRNNSAGYFERHLSEELSRYLSISLTEEEILNFDLLSFGADWQKTFPILSKIVRIVHCIPASSAEIERTWSAAGLILTSQRSRMNVKNFKYTLFCSKKYDFVSNNKDWLKVDSCRPMLVPEVLTSSIMYYSSIFPWILKDYCINLSQLYFESGANYITIVVHHEHHFLKVSPNNPN